MAKKTTKKTSKPTKYILLGANGTYYRGMTPIGPRYGATKAEALQFDSRESLSHEMGRHWAVSGRVEAVK